MSLLGRSKEWSWGLALRPGVVDIAGSRKGWEERTLLNGFNRRISRWFGESLALPFNGKHALGLWASLTKESSDFGISCCYFACEIFCCCLHFGEIL